jgi:hypothetical protein
MKHSSYAWVAKMKSFQHPVTDILFNVMTFFSHLAGETERLHIVIASVSYLLSHKSFGRIFTASGNGFPKDKRRKLRMSVNSVKEFIQSRPVPGLVGDDSADDPVLCCNLIALNEDFSRS